MNFKHLSGSNQMYISVFSVFLATRMLGGCHLVRVSVSSVMLACTRLAYSFYKLLALVPALCRGSNNSRTFYKV